MEKRTITTDVCLKEKQDFMLEEIWGLSIGGAFQRANIYDKNASEKDKDIFKRELKTLILKITKSYKFLVLEQIHLENIEKVQSLQNLCLNDNHLNFGVSQKLLNLYLKYLWCLDLIPTPPHFPVDRLIQESLFGKNLKNWTEMKNNVKYLEIINKAKEIAKLNNLGSISELELNLFERRSTNG